MSQRAGRQAGAPVGRGCHEATKNAQERLFFSLDVVTPLSFSPFPHLLLRTVAPRCAGTARWCSPRSLAATRAGTPARSPTGSGGPSTHQRTSQSNVSGASHLFLGGVGGEICFGNFFVFFLLSQTPLGSRSIPTSSTSRVACRFVCQTSLIFQVSFFFRLGN